MSKLHNGIEYKGGEKVWATGNARGGQLVGTVVGFTNGGQFRVKVDADQPARAGDVIRTFWVSPYLSKGASA